MRANIKSIAHRCHIEGCHLFEVAFVKELTKEIIQFPLGVGEITWGREDLGCRTLCVSLARALSLSLSLTHTHTHTQRHTHTHRQSRGGGPRVADSGPDEGDERADSCDAAHRRGESE